MKPIKFTIADGITLNVISTRKFKTAQLAINFLVPLRRETAAKNSLLSAVLLRGTAKNPTIADISRKLQSLYAASIAQTNYKRGEVQVFGLYSNFIDSKYSLDGCDILGGTLGMMAEMLFDPYIIDGAFCEEYVEGEKSNLIDKINGRINNKNSYALTRCHEEMCRDEAFGLDVLGSEETVKEITHLSLYEHHKEIIEKARIDVFYVGAESPEVILDKVKDMFSGINGRVPEPLSTNVKRSSDSVREIVEYDSVEQTKLSIGFRTGTVLSDSDYYKFSVFSEVYGSGTTSKLFMNVREKLSLCYYCQAVPEAQKGIMVVISGIEAEKYDAAREEILHQLDEVKNGNITDDEFDGAIESLCGDYMRIYDSPDMLEAWYIGRSLAGRCDSPEDAARMIKTVTKEDISEMAKKLTLDTIYTLKPNEEDK